MAAGDLNAGSSSSCYLEILTAVCCCTGIPTRWNFNAGSRSSCSLKILIAVCCLQDSNMAAGDLNAESSSSCCSLKILIAVCCLPDSNMAAGDLNAGSCSICSLKILTAVCCTGFQHGRWRSQRWQQQLGSTGAATAEKRLPCCYGPLQPSAPPHPTTTAQTCCDHW